MQRQEALLQRLSNLEEKAKAWADSIHIKLYKNIHIYKQSKLLYIYEICDICMI